MGSSEWRQTEDCLLFPDDGGGFLWTFGVERLELEFAADDNGEHERLRYE